MMHIHFSALRSLASYFPITDPSVIFLVMLLIILLAPIVMAKLRIPHIIGMVLAGIVIGQYGLNILDRDASFELFGRVGLYYIMFLASLEMDMEGLKKAKYQTLAFGLLTFCIPFVLIYVSGVSLLGFGKGASLILGCIMASNTLIAYPIVSRCGLQKKPSVTLSVGSTIVSLLLSLMVLATVVEYYQGAAGSAFWLVFALKFVLYCGALLWFMPRLTRWFLRRYSDAVMQYVFIMAEMFSGAVLAQLVGLEGIFGAFFTGLILNRYVPHVSPLMNRIEFIGNALFIPYFLIGVGMLINISLLFSGGTIILTLICLVLFGTLGKAIAAYFSCFIWRLPISSGHMMFGLTSAHAAGAIAMIMVGMRLTTPDGRPLVDEPMLNGVVIMILFTCVISSILTEWSAQKIVLRDKEIAPEDNTRDDEKILIPVKYPEYANELVNIAVMMRNPKLNRGLVALNVVYDDERMRLHQEQGKQLLEQVTQFAAGSDVMMQTQVRIAANIANGIKHAFKEFEASEIIIGMHTHENVSPRFWGQFHQSLFNGLSRQIIMARLHHPLSTLRRIQVAVPSRAQYEPGFYRWLERLARMTKNLECRIHFHGRSDTLVMIKEYLRNKHDGIRAEYFSMEHWNEMPKLASTIADDHLFVVVTARRGTVSFKNALERLPEELTKYFTGKNLMILFPDQYEQQQTMTFADPQLTEEQSAYAVINEWIHKKFNI